MFRVCAAVAIDLGGEAFSTSGLMVIERNFLDVYPYEVWSDRAIPVFQEGQTFRPHGINMRDGETQPPSLLSEAELIAKMDENGIGTDATIAEHIAKILEREYVAKDAAARFAPTNLGLGLVQGYMAVDLPLAKPYLRAQMEHDCKAIADGLKTREAVVAETIGTVRA